MIAHNVNVFTSGICIGSLDVVMSGKKVIQSSQADDIKGKIVISRLPELAAFKARDEGRKPYTNKEIAQATGISEHTIGAWMNNQRITLIHVNIALKIADFLGCEFNDLFLQVDESQ